MLDKHGDLFLGQETQEATAVLISSVFNTRLLSLPGHRSGSGKEDLHQLLLARYNDLDMSIADSGATTLSNALSEGVDDCNGVGMRFKLDKGVHCLATGTFHDNVDGMVRSAGWLRDDLGASTNSCNDLVLESSIWDLR